MLTLDTNLNTGEIGKKPTTQISGYNFNTYCKFGDKFLGCAADGIYELGGTTFNGTKIDAHVKTFNNRLGHTGNSRLRYIYLAVDTQGNLQIVISVDDVVAETITVTATRTGRQYIRVPVGKGSDGCYWNFKIMNIDGCWFSLEEVSVLPVYLSRGRK